MLTEKQRAAVIRDMFFATGTGPTLPRLISMPQRVR